ncbi:MAG: DUF2206 domain-containing protein [Candidatus Methanoperedens sp.]|nr:DUF2206 domain-containing protein [Candidatus Methanoperedens sp.]
MNDWKIEKFLKVILSIQLAMWGTIGLDSIGLPFPILRQIVGFIYLTFLPGILILRVLKLHKLGNIETLLYTVGLSISTLFIVGSSINWIYPFFGIDKPISTIPLIFTISVIISVFCILSYLRDKDFFSPSFINIKEVFSLPVLFLILIPFLAVFGTYFVNFHQNNILLLLMIAIISAIGLLIGYDTFIPKKLYPLTVFVIGISLLFHGSLISKYIWGWDIQTEYYFSNIVLTKSIWDSTIPSSVNGMLSIIMIAPIFSAISSMNLIWIFKIFYPFIFSLVPVGLYRVFQKQTNDKIAFLGCFFFMSLFVFYMEMLALARQQIAEFFLVLLILLMIDKNMNKLKKSILAIIFSFSLYVSHYGLSYIYFALLIGVWFLLYLNIHYRHKKIINSITFNFVLLNFAFLITWYMYTSSSSSFYTIVTLLDKITGSISEDFLNPKYVQGASLILLKTPSLLHELGKYVHLIAQLFISVGILSLFFKNGKMKFETKYVMFCVLNFIMLLAGVTIPYFAGTLNTSRLYHIALIFLAPFGVIGGIIFFKAISKIFKKSCTDRNSLKIISIFIIIFLLFNSGFIYEVAKDTPMSIALNSTIDGPRFNEQEVFGATWLYNTKNDNHVYADFYRQVLLRRFSGEWRILPDDFKIEAKSYMYFGTLNIKENIIAKYGKSVKMDFTSDYLNNTNKIYVNGGAQVYYR